MISSSQVKQKAGEIGFHLVGIATVAQQHPKLTYEGLEDLQEVFGNYEKAKNADIIESLKDCGEEMFYYWIGEDASPPGRAGGGSWYIVGRAHQPVSIRAGNVMLSAETLPSFPEARWHIENFIQFQSMGEKQRLRHARLLNSIMGQFGDMANSFFSRTTIPSQPK